MGGHGDAAGSVREAFLRRVFFFRNLGDAEIGELARLCEEEAFPAGEVVFSEGSVADKFYIVMDGKVEVWKAYEESGRSLLAVHGAGHFFGEMALIDELPRSATLVAREPSTALSIRRDDFQRLISSNSSVALSVMMSISLMVRSSNENFVADLQERNRRLEAANAELKAAQEELLRAERLSTIGKFSSLILHDIRNPLAVMKAVSEMLDMHAEDPASVKEDARRLRSEISRMEKLAQEFLDYSRGEIRLDLGVTDAGKLFSRLEDGMGDKLARSKVALECRDEGCGPFVLDEERFLRVLINLAENARKAMPGGGKLSAVARRSGERIEISVSDTGEGMEGEVLQRMFEPFYSKSGGGGTGLGMLIVKNIVEAHEGEISVRSERGRGTEITISVPSRL